MSNPYQNQPYQANNQSSYEMSDIGNGRNTNYNNYTNTNSAATKQYSSSNEDDFVQFMNEIQDINSQLDNYSNIINLIDNKQKSFYTIST